MIEAEHAAPSLTNAKDPADQPYEPDLTRLTNGLQGPLGITALAAMGLLTLALFYTFYVAQAFFMPIVIAVLLNFLLSPIVRGLKRRGLPTSLGAALVLVLLLGVLSVGLYFLTGPAMEWMTDAPEHLHQAEYKLRGIKASIEKVGAATQEIEELTKGEEDPREVSVQEATLSEALLNQTRGLVVGGVVLFFLLYFLLASGDHFLRKLVEVLPLFRHKRKAVTIIHRTEGELSSYFRTVTLINIGLGGAVALAMYGLGMPNPVLWGVLAGLLNFIPYVGGLLGICAISLVAIVSFDSLGYALLAPLSYLLINTIESYVVTPLMLGRRLLLNPVAVFLSIIFWGWIWGVPGGILAVPILVSFKIVCDNVEKLSAIGVFLGR